MKTQLKGLAWQRESDELRLVNDLREQFVLGDPDEVKEALLPLLDEGGLTPAGLAARLTAQAQPVSTTEFARQLPAVASTRRGMPCQRVAG